MTLGAPSSRRLTGLQERILKALESSPGLTDRELTNLLLGRSDHPSRINQECRLMADRGLIARKTGPDGLIRNHARDAVPAGVAQPPPSAPPAPRARPAPVAPAADPTALTEDELKHLLVEWLHRDGWATKVAWGKAQGVDVIATRDGHSWIIEAKGTGSSQPMRVNYFLGALGELLQRMNDPAARYSLALPDLPQFRRLWERLPGTAKQRLGLSALFVTPDGRIDHVQEAGGPA